MSPAFLWLSNFHLLNLPWPFPPLSNPNLWDLNRSVHVYTHIYALRITRRANRKNPTFERISVPHKVLFRPFDSCILCLFLLSSVPAPHFWARILQEHTGLGGARESGNHESCSTSCGGRAAAWSWSQPRRQSLYNPQNWGKLSVLKLTALLQ